MKITRGGRLSGDLTEEVARFTSSSGFDHYIAEEVVEINIAHVLALAASNYLRPQEALDLVSALETLKGKALQIPPELEDIHMVVEEEVTRIVGQEKGGKVHTGKSRNDQVATAIRMRLRRFMLDLCSEIASLQKALLDLAASNQGKIIVPGYTHLQHAQPVTVAHHLLAHHDAIARNFDRLADSYQRVNLSPMGAAALAGTGFQIDRDLVARYLGFSGIVENTMDAVASRDFALEVASSLTILMVDLSRFAEELVIWASSEFGYIEMPDDHSSTSSIMPQKKNPVTAEILRATTGRVFGDLASMVMIMKSLPLTYNLDMQQLTPHLWSSCESTSLSIRVLTDLVRKLRFDEKRIRESVIKGSSVATELADVLVREGGVAFRKAHHVVGAVVKALYTEGLSLSETPPERLQEMISKLSGIVLDLDSIRGAVSPDRNVDVRKVKGGPAYAESERMILERRRLIEKEEDLLNAMRRVEEEGKIAMLREIESLRQSISDN
ncbi:MAG: argininosuccinate lyase [Candidatus Verstraetearchaeota archaeon]|nr:argininosuccinate lyase [Candidatus Verstraetearchaeota archaeon]